MKTLYEKRLGYGYLRKDQPLDEYSFFGEKCLDIAEGIVYEEEHLKEALYKFRKELRLVSSCQERNRLLKLYDNIFGRKSLILRLKEIMVLSSGT